MKAMVAGTILYYSLTWVYPLKPYSTIPWVCCTIPKQTLPFLTMFYQPQTYSTIIWLCSTISNHALPLSDNVLPNPTMLYHSLTMFLPSSTLLYHSMTIFNLSPTMLYHSHTTVCRVACLSWGLPPLDFSIPQSYSTLPHSLTILTIAPLHSTITWPYSYHSLTMFNIPWPYSTISSLCSMVPDHTLPVHYYVLYSLTILYQSPTMYYIPWPYSTSPLLCSIFPDNTLPFPYYVLCSLTILYHSLTMFHITWPYSTSPLLCSIYLDHTLPFPYYVLYSLTTLYHSHLLCSIFPDHTLPLSLYVQLESEFVEFSLLCLLMAARICGIQILTLAGLGVLGLTNTAVHTSYLPFQCRFI